MSRSKLLRERGNKSMKYGNKNKGENKLWKGGKKTELREKAGRIVKSVMEQETKTEEWCFPFAIGSLVQNLK